MNKLKNFISNEHVGDQEVICFDRTFTPEELVTQIKVIESKLGLKLMAEVEGENLNGFVSTCVQGDNYCEWGDHECEAGHTSFIISLYGQSKDPEEIETIERRDARGKLISREKVGNPHRFVRTKITKSLKSKIKTIK